MASLMSVSLANIQTPPQPSKQIVALGRLEPAGGIIKLSAPLALDGDRVKELRVQEGSKIQAGQIIAVLDSIDRFSSNFDAFNLAMGYTDGYLFTIVLQEALILSILGFLPGIVASIGLYQIAQAATLLPIVMKIDRAIFVLILTILMCVGSGSIAIRKLQTADPADLF
jgi:multidrug efflux pump subunit AcrA (membrane-fusion protein)